jgi:hypothetical protein
MLVCGAVVDVVVAAAAATTTVAAAGVAATGPCSFRSVLSGDCCIVFYAGIPQTFKQCVSKIVPYQQSASVAVLEERGAPQEGQSEVNCCL